MKQKLTSVFIILIFMCSGCSFNNNLDDRIKKLNSVDYNVFKDLTIRKRNGVFIVQNHNKLYFVKRQFHNDIYTKDIPHKDMQITISAALDVFEGMNVQAVSVDSLNNIIVAFSVEKKCTHFIYRPSNKMTDSIFAMKYKKYDSEWYYDIVCSE